MHSLKYATLLGTLQLAVLRPSCFPIFMKWHSISAALVMHAHTNEEPVGKVLLPEMRENNGTLAVACWMAKKNNWSTKNMMYASARRTSRWWLTLNAANNKHQYVVSWIGPRLMIGWLSQTTMRRTPYQAFVVYTMEGFILKKIKGNETMKQWNMVWTWMVLSWSMESGATQNQHACIKLSLDWVLTVVPKRIANGYLLVAWACSRWVVHSTWQSVINHYQQWKYCTIRLRPLRYTFN